MVSISISEGCPLYTILAEKLTQMAGLSFFFNTLINVYAITQVNSLDSKPTSPHSTSGKPSAWPPKLPLSAQTHRVCVHTSTRRAFKTTHGLQPSIKQEERPYLATTAKSKITHAPVLEGSFQCCLNLRLAKAVCYTHKGRCSYGPLIRTSDFLKPNWLHQSSHNCTGRRLHGWKHCTTSAPLPPTVPHPTSSMF